MEKCSLCRCKSSDLNASTLEYGYFEEVDDNCSSDSYNFKNKEISYRVLGNVTKKVCVSCIKSTRKSSIMLLLLIMSIIIFSGLLALLISNENDDFATYFLVLWLPGLGLFGFLFGFIEERKLDEAKLIKRAEGLLWKKINPIVNDAFYPLVKLSGVEESSSIFGRRIDNENFYANWRDVKTSKRHDGSEVTTLKCSSSGNYKYEITRRRFVGRRPENIEDFKDTSSGIIYIPYPNKPLDFSEI